MEKEVIGQGFLEGLHKHEPSVGIMAEGRGRLAGFSLLGPTDASGWCSVLSSGVRALFFVLRAVARCRPIEKKWLLKR